MNAMEKVAWTELSVSLSAVVVVLALTPWLGGGAHAAFALLGLLVASYWFLRRHGSAIVVDERDRAIEQKAMRRGVEAAWMMLFVALIAIIVWSSLFNDGVVPTVLITWLVWIQFAVCYGVKGYIGTRLYRTMARAA